jgi:hypothetical protein
MPRRSYSDEPSVKQEAWCAICLTKEVVRRLVLVELGAEKNSDMDLNRAEATLGVQLTVVATVVASAAERKAGDYSKTFKAERLPYAPANKGKHGQVPWCAIYMSEKAGVREFFSVDIGGFASAKAARIYAGKHSPPEAAGLSPLAIVPKRAVAAKLDDLRSVIMQQPKEGTDVRRRRHSGTR